MRKKKRSILKHHPVIIIMVTSPMEQFYLYPLLHLKYSPENIYVYPFTRIRGFFPHHVSYFIDHYIFTISNGVISSYVVISVSILSLLLTKLYANNLFELVRATLISLCDIIIIENINSAIRYFTYFFFIFVSISMANLIGLIPYCYTVTSQLIITITLAGASFVAINIIAIQQNGLQFFALFLPSGTPSAIIPFIIIIELISYTARVFSLGIRLFANMMAGHTLLKIISSYTWLLLTFNIFSLLIFFTGLAVIFLVTCLELAIAILQAYVFTILIAIYLNDVLHIEH